MSVPNSPVPGSPGPPTPTSYNKLVLDNSLSARIALLSSRDLRAAIETAAATSEAVRSAIEVAVSNQLDEQQRRRALRKANVSSDVQPTGFVAKPSPLTPLYDLYFDEQNQDVAPRTTSNSESSTALEEKSPVFVAPAPAPAPAPAASSPATRVPVNSASLSAVAAASVASSSNNGGVRRGGGDAKRYGGGGGGGQVMRNYASGSVVPAAEALSRGWRTGFIFTSRHDTMAETFDRGIFGLPKHKLDLLAQVEPGTTALFLFDQTYRYLLGVYDAACSAALDLDEQYLRNGSRVGESGGSPFPAQVRFTRLHDFKPLPEAKFCHLISYQPATNVFRHKLGGKEVHELLRLMANPADAPSHPLPYESNGYKRMPENPRFQEQRRAAYGDA